MRSELVTRAGYVGAMRAAVTGVSVVTTEGRAGRLGRTVSALASVSADPPTLLVCINRRSPLADAIVANEAFGVSVLGVQQAAVAESFAGRAPAAARFDFGAAAWERAATGVPLLAGAAAWFDCVVDAAVEAATHTVVFGRVVAAEAGAAPPLAYTDGGYAHVRRAAVA